MTLAIPTFNPSPKSCWSCQFKCQNSMYRYVLLDKFANTKARAAKLM